jgi:plasmid maintenance system antidote protein VapI
MSAIMASDQSKLLLEHYLDYQRDQERQVSLKEYAALLGIHETTLNLLINDRRPKS